MLRPSIALALCASATAAAPARQAVVRTADPITRGLKDGDLPRTIRVTDNVYTYADFHAGPEKFTTTNMFVVTADGVLVADGQGSAAQTKALVDAIQTVTPQPITYVVIGSDHGDHTAGNASFPPASPTSSSRRRRPSSTVRRTGGSRPPARCSCRRNSR
jgi:glyoxylase-like metal-dependent hydrolase (beta-lactamase superfamily II)